MDCIFALIVGQRGRSLGRVLLWLMREETLYILAVVLGIIIVIVIIMTPILAYRESQAQRKITDDQKRRLEKLKRK